MQMRWRSIYLNLVPTFSEAHSTHFRAVTNDPPTMDPDEATRVVQWMLWLCSPVMDEASMA
jgi:hypothetical protein